MALSVAAWYEVSDWYSTTSPKTIASVTWSTGDRVVVACVGGDGSPHPFGTPSLTGFTFSSVQSLGPDENLEASVQIFTSDAAASGSSGTISEARGAGAVAWGYCVWVITGGPSATDGTSASNATESALSLANISTGSVVCYAAADWNATAAGKTPATGSGTATERQDDSNGTNYGMYMADWVGTSAGTFTFGPSAYTGWKSVQAAVEIEDGGGGGGRVRPMMIRV